MDGLNISKIIAGLRNPVLYLKKIKPEQSLNNTFNAFNSAMDNQKQMQTQMFQPTQILPNQLAMNKIIRTDSAVYIRNLLGLPQTLGEVLQIVQDKNTPIYNNLKLDNINQDILKNQKIISQIFDETTENLALVAQNIQAQSQQLQNNNAVLLFFSGMIRLPDISQLILKNSKQAVADLIIAMASASKDGINSKQIRETLSIINSCISMAEANNPTQTLKSLMLLYLPWLPLNEGIGFDLDITSPDGENESNDSKLTVLIQTRNYGNVKGVFTLTTSNSVDVYIMCSEDFPKNTLKKILMQESGNLAMNTTIDIDVVEPKSQNATEKVEAKVNLSATNEMNPYLLLMVHSFIRNTIYIDSNTITENPATL